MLVEQAILVQLMSVGNKSNIYFEAEVGKVQKFHSARSCRTGCGFSPTTLLVYIISREFNVQSLTAYDTYI